MEYLVGVILGLVVGGFATTSGFDRDRAFYPTVLIVIASYYSLFAVMGASWYPTLAIEIAVGLVFSFFAVLGFKKSMWLAVAGIGLDKPFLPIHIKPCCRLVKNQNLRLLSQRPS